jgi:aspartate/glutamate racemase
MNTSAMDAKGFLGIVMLDTKFPRPVGDVGHSETFKVPLQRDTVRGIWPAKVVQSAAGLHQVHTVLAFQGVVRNLEKRGAKAITTSCGFLVLLQKELQSAVRVPVVTSSLLQLPELLKTQQRVGVLTISSSALGKEHLRSAGVPRERLQDVVVQGVPAGTEFVEKILGNQTQMDIAQAQRDVVAAAVALKLRAPDVGTVVLECTNMPPYLAAIEAATGLIVLCLLDDPSLVKAFAPTPLARKVVIN